MRGILYRVKDAWRGKKQTLTQENQLQQKSINFIL